jgi:tRNA threonylcarbamoyladenosine modification (KEOPS) complex Cgi121 subunit
MPSLYGFGVLLWLAYGLFIDAQAVALTNVATAILIAAATVLKAWKGRQGLSRSVAAESLRE